MTGVYLLATVLEGKHLGLLHDLLPTAKSIAMLTNPNTPGVADQLRDAHSAASTIGTKLHNVEARTEAETVSVFAMVSKLRSEALLVAADPTPHNGCNSWPLLRTLPSQRFSNFATSLRLAAS